MAMKIRCQACRKKIAIDEAFAGGVCRCPYCKAITLVPGDTESAARAVRPDRPGGPPGGPRPAAPAQARPAPPAQARPAPLPPPRPPAPVARGGAARPESPARPHAPGQPGRSAGPVAAPRPVRPEPPPRTPAPSPAHGGHAAQTHEPTPAVPVHASPPASPDGAQGHAHAGHVPLAKPVLIQGVVTIVLGFLLVVMVGAIIALYVMVLGGRKEQTEKEAAFTAPPPPVNPLELPGPCVAGVPIEPPVVYVIDASAGMSDGLYDLDCHVLYRSVLSLGGGGMFNVVIVRETGPQFMSPSPVEGGKGGYDKARQFLGECAPAGATDLKAGIDKALDWPARSVVVLSGKGVEDAAGLIDKAKVKSAKVFAVRLEQGEDEKGIEALCRQSGGQVARFSRSELQDLLAGLPDLP